MRIREMHWLGTNNWCDINKYQYTTQEGEYQHGMGIIVNNKFWHYRKKQILNIVKARKLLVSGPHNEKYKEISCSLEYIGRRSPGRRKLSWLNNFRTQFFVIIMKLLKAVVNKVMIVRMAANIQNMQKS